MFTQSDGSMMSYSTPYVTFQEAIDRYNATADADHLLPHIPFHGLRHTSATLLIAGHQDLRTVSHRMGHAQTSTTMNIYVHALKESDRTASDLLEGMLGRPQSVPDKQQAPRIISLVLVIYTATFSFHKNEEK